MTDCQPGKCPTCGRDARSRVNATNFPGAFIAMGFVFLAAVVGIGLRWMVPEDTQTANLMGICLLLAFQFFNHARHK